MQSVITKYEQKYHKLEIVQARSGDTVKVHQTITEAGKKRIQIFEGTIIRRRRQNSLTAAITVRRISGGFGVEKTFFLHSPNLVKVEVTKRSKVRRNFLSYLRKRAGKSARLSEKDFDTASVNVKEEVAEKPPTKEEAAELAKEAEAEKPSKKEIEAEGEPTQPDKSEKAETADMKSEQMEKKTAKAKEDTVDKVSEKKAKAEAFRQAQEAKKK